MDSRENYVGRRFVAEHAQFPLEASGRADEAALNGVPSLSILDGGGGGHIEGVTGWSIGNRGAECGECAAGQ